MMKYTLSSKLSFILKLSLGLSVGLTLLTHSSSAYAGENVININPDTGEWVFRFNEFGTGAYVKQKYTPPTLIEPTMQSAVAWNGKEFAYFYSIRNSDKAKQEIVSMMLHNIPVNIQTRKEPYRPTEYELNSTMGLKEKYEMDKNLWLQEQKIQIEKRMQYTFQWQPKLETTSKSMTYGWKAVAEGLPTGIKPGQTRQNMRFLVPGHLPGIALARLMGRTSSPSLLEEGNRNGMPIRMPVDDNAYRVKVLSLMALIGKETPVIVPLLKTKEPYDGVTLAYDLKAHVQTWVNLGFIDAATLVEINDRFYTLTSALQLRDKVAVRKACHAMFALIFKHQPTLDHTLFGNDDDDPAHEVGPLLNVSLAADGTLTELPHDAANARLHRLAARVLAYNVMYLLEKSESYVKPKSEGEIE